MPALQVRDFPQELYQELKDFSALNHRSMAQQTIFAVDAMIHSTHASSEYEQPSNSADRLKKRESILRRAGERHNIRTCKVPSPTEMLSKARKEHAMQTNIFAKDFLESSK